MWRCSRRRPSGSGTRRLAGSWRAPRGKRTTRKRGTPPSVPDGRAGRGRLRSELRHRAGPVRKSDDRGLDVEALTSSVCGREWRSAPAAREIHVPDPLLVRTSDPEGEGVAVSFPKISTHSHRRRSRRDLCPSGRITPRSEISPRPRNQRDRAAPAPWSPPIAPDRGRDAGPRIVAAPPSLRRCRGAIACSTRRI